MSEFVLTFVCPDKLGIVRTVSDWLFQRNGNILDSDQYGDAFTEKFFMRVHFTSEEPLASLSKGFQEVASSLSMNWEIWPTAQKPKTVILVSKQDHCLVDLLYRTRNEELPIEISLVASNHQDTRQD